MVGEKELGSYRPICCLRHGEGQSNWEHSKSNELFYDCILNVRGCLYIPLASFVVLVVMDGGTYAPVLFRYDSSCKMSSKQNPSVSMIKSR